MANDAIARGLRNVTIETLEALVSQLDEPVRAGRMTAVDVLDVVRALAARLREGGAEEERISQILAILKPGEGPAS